jgi:hypothetical protein
MRDWIPSKTTTLQLGIQMVIVFMFLP